MSTKETQAAIASYVTDMLALEEHIQKALTGQIEDAKDDPFVQESLRTTERMCTAHIATLEALAERREMTGQGLAESVKKAAANVLGLGAAAIDMVRTQSVPKNLRDDYTALSLACIGYVMLHTVGKSLSDEEVARIALQHLEDHAKCVMTFHNVIPVTVVQQLQADGLPAHTSVLEEIGETIQRVWRSESGVPQTGDVAHQVHA